MQDTLAKKALQRVLTYCLSLNIKSLSFYKNFRTVVYYFSSKKLIHNIVCKCINKVDEKVASIVSKLLARIQPCRRYNGKNFYAVAKSAKYCHMGAKSCTVYHCA